MYLALALAPWILLYALSTLVMNHRAWFRSGPPGTPPPWQVERTTAFAGVLPEGGDPKPAAAVLLASLGLDGAHSVTRRAADGALVIQRQDLLHPRRITYTPADGRLVVEALPQSNAAFLERFHRRRGYQQNYWADDIWAFGVDAVIAALLFWMLSGVWLWWEIKPARRLGLLACAGGAALFAFYLVVL
jgi:hypothetical protein